jgi:outer membrane protein assembly factor BamE (lipoprotein component of BamABCDE complex)
MNPKLKLTLTATVAGLLVGCASVGQNFDESKVSQIKKGETTEPELIQMFGQPQQRGVNSEGQSVLTWMYSEATVKGESFIPYAGAFIGGTNTKDKTLTVILQDGRVESFTASAGGMESRGMAQDVPKK